MFRKENSVPAWSPEIANEFIRLAANDGRALDQIQLQKLVYIAHGWCLAVSGQPLTGDRPEAWEFGPVYPRLADALAAFGLDPVTRELTDGELFSDSSRVVSSRSELDALELDVITRIYHDYGDFTGSQLSTLTRRGSAPWREVYAQGAGRLRDIPHELIRTHFVKLANGYGT
jgi:uncharacterized phage-associated protein